MSEGVPYADIVILALVAGFILLRLRGVLGDKVGNDNPSYFQKPSPTQPERKQAVVQLEEKTIKPKQRHDHDPAMTKVTDERLVAAINDIKSKDADFALTSFMEGAKGAFEMVFDAFARDDVDTLRFLLSERVFREFEDAMRQREQSPHKMETTLVSVEPAGLTGAELVGNVARLTLRFASEQVSVTRDTAGAIVDGDPAAIQNVDDEWTFERDVTSKNPNWKVTET